MVAASTSLADTCAMLTAAKSILSSATAVPAAWLHVAALIAVVTQLAVIPVAGALLDAATR